MQYRLDKKGNPISVLGYGCMRFTQTAGKTDIDKTETEIMTAFENGVNYYDTAYIYPGSEAALGEILKRNYIRDSVNITTKLPQYKLTKPGDAEKIFKEELKRLKTDHVDYYLMHMLNDVSSWERIVKLGITEWLEEKKKNGKIGQVGFSYHGNSDMFLKVVDAYDWDLCQIQYNYLDEHSQAGRTGLDYAHKKGLPVIIMEPLRGGRLVNNLPKKAAELFREHPSGRTPAEWGLRWLYDQPEVTCVLSGMNSIEMVRENLKTADEAPIGCMTEEDREFIRYVVSAFNDGRIVGCTGCRYCMPCPHNVDIPGTFSAYNKIYSDGKMSAKIEYFQSTALRAQYTGASQCVGCGICETRCPQHLPIRAELKNASKALETFEMRIARKLKGVYFKY